MTCFLSFTFSKNHVQFIQLSQINFSNNFCQLEVLLTYLAKASDSFIMLLKKHGVGKLESLIHCVSF